jgi:uncharacterized protein YegP (UPF0339 family)
MNRTVTFKDKAGEWRWKRLSENNKETAASDDGYTNKGDCIESASSQFPDDLHFVEDPETGHLTDADPATPGLPGVSR